MNKKLSDKQLLEILEEDIPLDNGSSTEESDFEEEMEENTNVFDNVFEEELSKLFGNVVSVQQRNKHDENNKENLPDNINDQENLTVDKEGSINKIWKKNEKNTAIPSYNFNEGVVNEL